LYKDHDSVVCGGLKESDCEKVSECFYDNDDSMCKHNFGWTPIEQGVFAAGMIIGGMVGSYPAGLLVKKVGHRRTMMLGGLIGLVAIGVMVLGVWLNVFAVQFIARVVIGVLCSICCVACPVYVQNNAPTPQLKARLGVLFQVFCTFGIFLAAAIGLGLAPKKPYNGDLHLLIKLVVVNVIPLPIFIGLGVLAFSLEDAGVGEGDRLVNSKKTPEQLDDDDEVSVCAPLVAGAALCVAQQFTGINAIMNFSGQITKAFGMAPLNGNVLVMTWNFVTCVVSIPLSAYLPARRVYMVCLLVASVACFLSGLASFPGIIKNKDAGHVLGAIGVAIFVAAFEVGMGSFFWSLATSIFPPFFRERGCGIVNVLQFAANVGINFGFPVAVVALSGGKSGDQNKGLAMCFIFFGAVGLVCLPILFKFLHPWDARATDEDEERD
jgi:MFS family permease